MAAKSPKTHLANNSSLSLAGPLRDSQEGWLRVGWTRPLAIRCRHILRVKNSWPSHSRATPQALWKCGESACNSSNCKDLTPRLRWCVTGAHGS